MDEQLPAAGRAAGLTRTDTAGRAAGFTRPDVAGVGGRAGARDRPDDHPARKLIAAGVEIIAERGAAAVSLREIARAAGVSHGAPRRYFPTHLDLLAGIAAEGFAELESRVTTALAGASGPAAQITALAYAYVDFAAARRGMFELMFRHELLRGNGVGLREHSQSLFRLLAGLFAAARTSPGDPEVLAAAFWANLHGLAELRAWGSLRVALGADDVEPLLTAALAAYLPAADERRPR